MPSLNSPNSGPRWRPPPPPAKRGTWRRPGRRSPGRNATPPKGRPGRPASSWNNRKVSTRFAGPQRGARVPVLEGSSETRRRGRPALRQLAEECERLSLRDVAAAAGNGPSVMVGSQVVTIVREECNYGGARLRAWLVCPGRPRTPCDRRVEHLYRPPGRNTFLCRRCHRLFYRTQRVDRLGRRLFRAGRLRERIGAVYSGLPLVGPATVPPRPWGRHRHRWVREVDQFVTAEQEARAELVRTLMPLGAEAQRATLLGRPA